LPIAELARIGRRSFLKSAGAFATASLSIPLQSRLLAQVPQNVSQSMSSGFANAPIVTTRISGKMFVISGPGGSIAVLTGDDGSLLVDTGVPEAANRTRGTLDAMGSLPVQMVVNSHWHWDHSGGNAELKTLGATIVAHQQTRNRLLSPQYLAMIDAKVPASPAAGLPSITFANDMDLFFAGEHIHLTYIGPSHSDSDICIHFAESNVLHAGDCWINGSFPLIDYSNRGSAEGYVSAVGKMLALADSKTVIIPGHSSHKRPLVGDRAALTEYHDMMGTICERIRKLKSEGNPIEAAVANRPTADFDGKWGGGITSGKRFTELVYLSL